jgi:hypothetical protein
MGTKRPTVWVEAWSVPPVAWLEELGQGTARIRLDTAEWNAWLDGTGGSFAYQVFNPGRGYIEGFMTVRKEGRQRGGNYWRVYRRCGAKVRKVYLGRTEAVTNERLAAIARAFLSEESLRQEAESSPVPSY